MENTLKSPVIFTKSLTKTEFDKLYALRRLQGDFNRDYRQFYLMKTGDICGATVETINKNEQVYTDYASFMEAYYQINFMKLLST